MANTPNTVTITVTNAEVAAELEALALAYEETVQKLRYEADRLRQGFDLTLNVSATQVMMKPTPDYQELDDEVTDEEMAEAFAEANRVSSRLAPKGTRIKPEDITGGLTTRGGLPPVGLLPAAPTDPQVARQWRKGPHFLPWGNDITTCGINTKGTVRLSWDENRGDWVHPTRPGVMKAMITAQLKFVDCPDCRAKITETFAVNPEGIEWMIDDQAHDQVVGNLPEDAIRLIDEMTKTTTTEEEE